MILILDCGSSKVPFIEQGVDEWCDYVTKPVLEHTQEDIDAAQGIIISGAPILVTEQQIDHYLDRLSWIKSTTKPVLGICFGHQLMGILHGAKASRIREDRDWQTIEFLVDDPITNKLPNEVEMMEDHCEAISIPPDFELLAVSDACVNEGMKHKEKPLYGVQFHPEVSGNMGNVFIGNFVSLCLA
jgi:GMP synthase (glutamine-hydrolysing)